MIFFIFINSILSQDRQPCEDLVNHFYQILDENQETFQFVKQPEEVNSFDNEFQINYHIDGFEDQDCQMTVTLQDFDNCDLDLVLFSPYEETHISFKKLDQLEDEEMQEQRVQQFEEPIKKFIKNLKQIVQENKVEGILQDILDDPKNFENVFSIQHQKIEEQIVFVVVFTDETYEEEEHPFFVKFEDYQMIVYNDFVQKAIYLDVLTKSFLKKEFRQIVKDVINDYYYYQKFLRPSNTQIKNKRVDFCKKFFDEQVYPITKIYPRIQFEKKDDFQHDLFVGDKDNIIGGFRCEQKKEHENLLVLSLKVFIQKINLEESFAFNIEDDYDQSQILDMLVKQKVRIMIQSAGLDRKKMKIFDQ